MLPGLSSTEDIVCRISVGVLPSLHSLICLKAPFQKVQKHVVGKVDCV